MSATRDFRRARRHTGWSLPLFPFLAVLVCTMGSLLVVLVVLARQAKIQAARAATAEAAARQSELATAHGMARWRIAELVQSRDRAQAELAHRRLELGHLENHIGQLQHQVEKLQAELEALAHNDSQSAQNQEELEANRNALEQQVARAQRELEEAQRALRQRRKSYAVVPYEGPSGTHRRPIYIECRSDRIALQPEGVVLVESDFEEPPEPGNALDRALRAAREALLAQNAIRGDGSDEPYPLLLVRPDGIAAYYAARAAMRSWKSEVGYELVGEDWELAFPAPDSRVAQAMREAVLQARAERSQRAVLAAMAAAGPSGVSYRAAPGGGLIREEGGKPLDGKGPGVGAAAGGLKNGPGRSNSDPPAALPSARHWAAPPTPSTASSAPQPPSRQSPLRPGEWLPQERPNRAESDAPLAASSDVSTPARTKRLADHRGENWGLPNAAKSSVGITRPILVHCYADRLEILPEVNSRSARVVLLPERTEEAVDELVSAVWEHMKQWGIAGRGMYWKPVLKVFVAVGAEARFAELRILLDGSGLEIQRHEAGHAEVHDPDTPARTAHQPSAPPR